MTRKAWVSVIVIVLIASLIPIIIEIAPTVIPAETWYVDDVPGGNPPEDFTSIQDAVNASQPGDTVFVWNGTYYEDVEINKTINLIGESRDNVIINGSDSSAAIYVNNADYVNITGITVEDSGTGISLYLSNNSLVKNNRAVRNKYGIIINSCNNSIVQENFAFNNSNYHGIYLSRSTNITVKNNTCFGNQGKGIYILDNSNKNLIIGNNCSSNADGIRFSSTSFNNFIYNNTIISNFNYGIGDSSNGGNIYINNSIKNSWTGIHIATFTQDVHIFNSTIENSSNYDISVAGSNTHFTTINTTFDKTKSYFGGLPANLLIVKWYLHVNVVDYLGNPVPNAQVNIEDNINASYNETFMTDVNGYLRWLTVTEFIEQDLDGDTIGEKIFYTPHKIVAWNDTLVGYVYPEPIINVSKTVTIILYNGTSLDLEHGWNLISLPRIQSNTDRETVLQSTEGRYDSVQWYNASDNSDHWKHYNILKPSFLNDLQILNHTMGFWLHITDPEGTILVVLGDELISDQNISLFPGWNLVGFLSKANKTRDIGLGTLSFGIDVDSIWTYNATTQKWVELNDALDYFKIGQGYWIHAKTECVWNVPL